MEKLAIHGGLKTKTTPFGTGKRFGEEELTELREALEQNTLFYAHGKKTKQLEEAFATLYGVKHCIGVSSGSAAIHTALAALDVGPGDEVITSPITDMGSVIGILLQNAVPMFCDIDPHTYNMDPASVEARITRHTKVIEVVHLAGNPCDMHGILAVAKRHGLRIVEDCAQSYLCSYRGQLAGTFGDFGCFSLNDFKHISAGDAGLLITQDPELARRARLFSDKGYQRSGTAATREPTALACNYRINELESAVALAQLKKLSWICHRRNQIGEAITAGIRKLPGISPHRITEGGKSSYWFYMFRIDEKRLGVSMEEFGEALLAEGIPCGKGYTRKCVYQWPLFRDKRIYANFNWPSDFPQYGRDIAYPDGLCPVAEQVLRTCITIPISEFYTDEDVEDIVKAVEKVARWYG